MQTETDSFNARVPEFNAVAILQQRLAQKKAEAPMGKPANSKGSFDPYQLMVKRRREDNGEVPADQPVQSWPSEDIAKLEDFCRKMGVVGFNCGTMNPIAALALLKQKLGVVDEFPKSEGYGPNYPYTEAMQKRILLKG